MTIGRKIMWVGVAVCFAATAAGCGSALSDKELAATNGTRSSASDATATAANAITGVGDAGDAVASGPAGATATAGADATATPTGPTAASGATGQDASAAIPAGSGAVAPGSRSPIVLGSLGVAGGPIGETVAAAPDGARAWVASVNARGGLNGHPVRLVVANDNGDASRAASIVRQMVEQQGVVALYGTYAPTTLQAVTPYLEQHNVPLIGGVSGNFVEETSPMVFNPQAGPSIVAVASAAIVGALSPPDKRKLAIFYCFESEQCASIRNGLVKRSAEFGVKIVYEAQVSLAQPDFTSQISQARAAGADVVFGAFDLNSLLRLVNGAHRQGWRPTFAGAFQFDTDDIKPYSDELQGLLGFSLTVNYDASALLDPYRSAVRRFVPNGHIGGLGAQAWAQGRLLEAIAPRLGPKVTSADLINALYTLKAENLGGLVPPITFNHGPHRDVNHCYIPTRFTGGRWTEPLGETFRCLNY